MGVQDKQIMTRFERENWGVADVRRDGVVLNRRHCDDQNGRNCDAAVQKIR